MYVHYICIYIHNYVHAYMYFIMVMEVDFQPLVQGLYLVYRNNTYIRSFCILTVHYFNTYSANITLSVCEMLLIDMHTVCYEHVYIHTYVYTYTVLTC